MRVHVPYSIVYAARSGLAGKYAKVVGGGLHKGGDSTIHCFIFEKWWLKGNSVQRHGGGLHEGAAYTSEYGTVIVTHVFTKMA